MSIIIREATLADAQSITKVNIQAWQESYTGIVEQEYLDNLPAIFAKRLESRQQILSSPNLSITLIAQQLGGEILGYCQAGVVAKNSTAAKGEIYSIYVLEKFQNRGIGKTLLHQAFSFLTANNLTPITVATLRDNISARKFYEHLGGVLMAEENIEIGEKTYVIINYLFL